MTVGSFTFSIEPNKDGHMAYLTTENTTKDFYEMVLMFLLYLGNHDEELMVDILQLYDANMHDQAGELYPLTATLQA